jgi:ABC-type lipoprotein export system ATPase subunit/CRP-like cAMP-binding protein
MTYLKTIISKMHALTSTPAARPTPRLAPAENGSLIELRQVVKTYQTPAGPFTALRNIDLQVKAGEFAAVIGKSGSGKSTLINMVTGIDRPTLGEILIDNIPIHSLDEDDMATWRGQHLGVIFQFFQLLPTLTLLENVMLPMQLSNTYAGGEREERALHLLDTVGLADQARKFPSAVSGGQQQRAAIARALANDPRVLVADEPTGSLDSKTADSIFQLFENFVSQGRTILMVTHDRDLASRVSRVILIADGEITDQYISKAFSKLDQSQMVQVSSRLDPVTYEPGAVIFKQGDPADKFYIIIKGQVEIIIEHATGQEVIGATLGSGQYFGEMGLLEDKNRTATVRVSADSEAILMALDRGTFNQLMLDSKLTHETIAGLMRQRVIADQMLTALQTLDLADLANLDSTLERLVYHPGEVIFSKGDPSEKFYFIVKGEVEVVQPTAEADVVLQRLGSGQFFGEIGLITNRERSATVRVSQTLGTDTEVIAVGREAFQQLRLDTQETDPEFQRIMARRRLAGKLAQFGFGEADGPEGRIMRRKRQISE